MEQYYKIQDFISFMCDKRIDGGDINNWSLEDLKEAVVEFK